MFKHLLTLCCLLSAFCFSAVAAGPVIQTTPYSRDLLKSANYGVALQKLGLGTYDTNASAILTNSANNSVALSNFWNNGGGLLPPGIIQFSTPIIVTANGSAVFGNRRTILRYTGPVTSYAITLAGQSNAVTGISFDFQQAKNTTSAASLTNGAIFANPIGGLVVQDCGFRNIAGTCLFVHGDSDIVQRSNAWRVAGCDFFSFGNGVRGAQTNRSEFGSIVNNTFYDSTGDAIFSGGANNVIQGNLGIGYLGATDFNGGRERGIVVQPTPTGVFPSRSHTIVSGNHMAHYYVDGAFLDCLGGGGVVTANTFGGSAYTIVSNTFNLRFINNLVNPYITFFLTNNTSFTLENNQISATMSGTTNGYRGSGNYFGNGDTLPNDRVQVSSFDIPNVGTLTRESNDTFKLTKWSGGYGALVLDSLYAKTRFLLEGAAIISYQGTADTISLDAWSGGIGTGKLKAARVTLGVADTTNLIFSGSPEGTPGVTVSPNKYLIVTNGGARFYLPLYQ